MLGRLLLIAFAVALTGAGAVVLPLWRELPSARPVKAELTALSGQHGAEWVTYVAAMHGGRAYILRVWTGRETGITGLDELLAGFRFPG